VRRLRGRFDDWQDGAGRVILAKREDGTYAARRWRGHLDPRQVGKTFLVGAIVFALCLLYPGLTVLVDGAPVAYRGETFAKMQAFAKAARR
jgi:hypothetical protein